jgi:hypothetical protein
MLPPRRTFRFNFRGTGPTSLTRPFPSRLGLSWKQTGQSFNRLCLLRSFNELVTSYRSFKNRQRIDMHSLFTETPL